MWCKWNPGSDQSGIKPTDFCGWVICSISLCFQSCARGWWLLNTASACVIFSRCHHLVEGSWGSLVEGIKWAAVQRAHLCAGDCRDTNMHIWLIMTFCKLRIMKLCSGWINRHTLVRTESSCAISTVLFLTSMEESTLRALWWCLLNMCLKRS